MKKKNKSIPPMTEEGGEALSFEELALLRKEGAQYRTGEEPTPYDTSDRAHLRRYIKKNPLLTAAVIVILLALVALLIFGAAMMVGKEMRLSEIQKFVFPHPTVGEVLRESIF